MCYVHEQTNSSHTHKICADKIDVRRFTNHLKSTWRGALQSTTYWTSIAAVVLLSLPNISIALSNEYVTTRSDWNTSVSGGLWNVDARFKAIHRPGNDFPYFYARQGSLTNGTITDTWYMGLQTDAAGPNGRIAIFSIWNARESAALDNDAECVTFGNEGSGHSCRLRYNWIPERTYRLRVWRQNDGWWLATVYDEVSGRERSIGRIRARAGQGNIGSRIIDFVEYYGGDFPSCAELRPSRVTFFRPTGNNGRVAFTAGGTRTGNGVCGQWRHARQSANSAEHLMGMNGPYIVRTVLAGERCLDAGGGGFGAITYMRDCDLNNPNLRWFLRADGGISTDVAPEYRCLDANTGQFGRHTYMRTCNPRNGNLTWGLYGRAGHSQIVSNTPGRRCLDANTGAFGRPTYMRDCDDGANLNLLWRWQRL